MKKEELIETIEIGLNKGYTQNLLLLSSFDDFIDNVREYLLTVNVAQQLLEWNSSHRYKIRIEYPVRHFYSNAFLSHDYVGEDIFDMKIVTRSREHSPTSRLNQKIDLAIALDEQGANGSTHERSIVGIELKGINKNPTDIINDAQRMSKAMLSEDKVSKNSIRYCFCGFIQRLDSVDEIVTENVIKERIRIENIRWVKTCNELMQKFSKLKFSIQFKQLMSTSLEQVQDMYRHRDSDYSEVAESTGILVSGILIIERY